MIGLLQNSQILTLCSRRGFKCVQNAREFSKRDWICKQIEVELLLLLSEKLVIALIRRKQALSHFDR